MNTYILFNELDTVINTIEMPEEPVNENLLLAIKNQSNGSYFLRLSDHQDSLSNVESITSVNAPNIGSAWDGTGFLSPSLGTEYMLDYTGYNWIPIPPDISESGTFEWDPENLSWSEQ